MDLFDKEIDLDKEASDILILEGAYLKNLATGKTGTLGEVVRGRKFIMLDSNPEQVTVSGYYATYDEYQDEILIITAEKKPGQGWRETARCVFYWQDQFLKMKHTGMDVISTTGMFDICGQALTYEEGG